MDENKYPELSKFVGIQKVYGIIIMVIAVIGAGVWLIASLSAGGVLLGLGGALGIIFAGYLFMNLVIAIGETARVLMDIEENTSTLCSLQRKANNGDR